MTTINRKLTVSVSQMWRCEVRVECAMPFFVLPVIHTRSDTSEACKHYLSVHLCNPWQIRSLLQPSPFSSWGAERTAAGQTVEYTRVRITNTKTISLFKRTSSFQIGYMRSIQNYTFYPPPYRSLYACSEKGNLKIELESWPILVNIV